MIGSTMIVFQSGVVTADQVQEAPNLKLQTEVNAVCLTVANLQCCVQQNFTVQWYEGGNILKTGKYKLMSCSHSSEYTVLYLDRMVICSCY